MNDIIFALLIVSTLFVVIFYTLWRTEIKKHRFMTTIDQWSENIEVQSKEVEGGPVTVINGKMILMDLEHQTNALYDVVEIVKANPKFISKVLKS